MDFRGGELNGVRGAIPADYPVGIPLRMDSYWGEVVYTLNDEGVMEPAEQGEGKWATKSTMMPCRHSPTT